MSIIHLDYETVSPLDLKKVGAYRYAEEARILIMAFAVDDGEPYIWNCVDGCPDEHLEILSKAVREGWRFYAHNAQFEHAISQQCLLRDVGVEPPALEQWFCTAAMARRAGLPSALAKVAPALRLPETLWKDSKGTALINKFSKTYSKSYRKPEDDLEAFDQFCDYCRQDVRVEQAIHSKLKTFDFPTGGMVRDTWCVDQLINEAGVPVNIPAIEEAIRITQAYETRLSDRFREITGLNPTQRDKVLQWAKSHGYQGENMQGVALDKALAEEGLPAETTEALQIKRDLGFAAVAKLKSMRNCACKDGRVRGTLLYYGAGTGRWSGRLIQPQNFKRPAFKDTPLVLDLLKSGQGDEIEMLWGNPQDAISSSIRHFIALPDGQPMLDVDFSSVEARIVCWLAGQKDALEEYRAGVDRYVRMASIIFGKPEKDILGDERWLGKGAVLGCGFGIGHKKFYDQSLENAELYGIDGIQVTPELCEMTVRKWRRSHDKVVKLWYACDDAVREAIMRLRVTTRAGDFLQFRTQVDPHTGINYLIARLPSGRKLYYPHPEISEAGDITYWGQIPMKQIWGRVKLYGGKIVENVTQAIAADLMALGTIRSMKEKFKVFALIHDQGLSEKGNKTINEYEDLMREVPEWATGLPIEVEGKETPFYTK